MIDAMKVKTNSKKWSKSVYFLFAPEFAYEGKIMKAEDFVIRVKITCIGCVASPGWPSLYKCKDENGKTYNRGQEEIFDSAEACLAERGVGFDQLWIQKTKSTLARSVSFYESQAESMELRAKDADRILKEFVIHVLVAETFLEKPKGYTKKWVVMHLDDVRTNCHVSNLRYGTQAENQQQRAKNSKLFNLTENKDEKIVRTACGFGIRRTQIAQL